MLNRVEIKKKARQKIQGNLWTIWKPVLIIYGSMVMLEVIAIALQIPLLGFIVGLLALPLSIGLMAYVLAFARGKDYSIAMMFNSYKKIGLIILTSILIYIFTFLWTLLLIIPGIIAAYSYIMWNYLIADDEEEPSGPYQVIRKSKKMMKGYKFDYFIFQLSFLLWGILVSLTLGLAAIYVLPYTLVANAIYYDELKKKQSQE